jgi:hypothetical protein
VEILTSQDAPPVSTTPAANFSTSFASVVDTGGKHGNNYQTADNVNELEEKNSFMKQTIRKKSRETVP